MKKYDTVIFDLDGVLVFTDKLHYQAWKRMADKMDIYFDEEINNRLRGVSRMDSLEIILENYHDEPLCTEKKEELADLQTQYEEQVQQNKDIEKTIKENDEAVIAEKYAREEGYVKTDERVYIDITPGT